MSQTSDRSRETIRLRRALQAAGIGVWEWNFETGRFSYSVEAREIIGVGSDVEVTLAMLRSITHPDDLPITSAQAAAANGTGMEGACRILQFRRWHDRIRHRAA